MRKAILQRTLTDTADNLRNFARTTIPLVLPNAPEIADAGRVFIKPNKFATGEPTTRAEM